MNKTFSLLGDSITTFDGCNPAGFRVYYEGEQCARTGVASPNDTWWHQVIAHFEGELLANASFSGSMVEGAGFPAGNSDERVAALAANGVAPDVILTFIGINDYGWGGAQAQAAGRGNSLPTCLSEADLPEPQVAGLAAEDAGDRFEAAYSAMLARVRAAYPAADVWCCTLCPGYVAERNEPTFTYCLRGVPFDRYNQAIRSAAEANGCKVADLRMFRRDYETVDGTHPTKRGMKQLAGMVVQAMELEGAPRPSSNSGIASAIESARPSVSPCDRPDCIGCPDAASTGNQWQLVCNRSTAI